MPDYTEAACDACPRKCRAGVYVATETTPRRCPTATPARAAWRMTDFQTDVRPSLRPAPAPMTSIPAGETVLLGCQGCGTDAPCMLEITGPVTEQPKCVLGIESRSQVCVWYRIT